MKILGIESSTTICAASVADGGRIVTEHTLDGRQMHSEKLVLLVEAALAEASLAVRDLDGIAVSIGPGSFTGLRIGLSVAKGLAYAAGRPLAAVPTLEALAAQAVRMNAARDGDRVAPMIDARRNEVYTALYEVRDGGVCHPLTGAEAVDVASLAARMAGGRRTVLCGDGAAKFLEAAAEPSRYTMTACGCSAAAVALLGERLLAGGGGAADLASLEPLYIKEFSSTAHL